MAERQRIIESNRSLRLIKNELESLLEKGIIADDAFDTIQRLLPAESSLSAAHTPASRTAATASPTPSSPHVPANGFSNLSLNDHTRNASTTPAPPSYTQSAGAPPGPPPADQKAAAAPPPPPPQQPSKPVLCHARALYKYTASDARDCSFDRDDRIAVHEYMNADWWMGQNLRTGEEGIFPKNYVEVEAAPPPGPPPNAMSPDRGYGGYQPPGQPVYGAPGGYPPPPGQQQNPYDSNVPPMAVAGQAPEGQQVQGQPGQDGSKVGEYGKKFGKKLGNAAIFGAGATLGADIVNSIF